VTENSPVVLVWHDRGQTTADAIAGLGELDAMVVAPSWEPLADDGGRASLLVSVREAREQIEAGGGDPNELVLVGFGLGAVAAAGLTLHAKRLGIGLGMTVCVAPRWDEPDPISGVLLSGPPERVELVDDPADVSAQITCWRQR
jgi:predicted esterase